MADRMLLQSFNFPDLFIRHHNFEAELMRLAPEGREREDFFWFEEDRGRDDDGAVLIAFRAFQRFNGRDHFLRHQNFRLVLQPDDGTQQFEDDSTFRRRNGLSGDPEDGWKSFEAKNRNLKDHWVRHHSFHLFVNRRTDADKNFRDDATFIRNRGVIDE